MIAKCYRAHGLTISSELELPEFSCGTGAPDVTIRLGSQAAHAAETVKGGGTLLGGFQRCEHGFVKVIRDVGAVLVIDGSKLIVSPAANHDPSLLKLFVLGSGIGMMLHQRGRLVLHGAAVVAAGKARVILGPSGAGKSTLVAHLGERGFGVLNDDLSGVCEHTPGEFTLWPGAQVVKLWGDTVASLNKDPAMLDRVQHSVSKFWASPQSVAPDQEAPLAEILVLTDAPDLRIEDVSCLNAIQAVTENIYRPHQVGALGKKNQQFLRICRLVERMPVRTIHRPRALSQLNDVVELLAQRWDAQC